MAFAKPSAVPTVNFPQIDMYPNPVSNKLNIETAGEIQQVSVYRLLGQEVLTKKPISNKTTLETTGLQKGVYITKITIDGKESVTKFIKE